MTNDTRAEQDVAVGPQIPVDIGVLFNELKPVNGVVSTEAVLALARRIGELINCRVSGIILYGSMTHGRTWPPGDMDALILVESAVRGGMWGNAGEVQLDVFIESSDTVLADKVDNWLHVADGLVAYDTSGKLDDWLKKLIDLKATAPRAANPSHLLRSKVWAQRMIQRIVKRRAQDPTLGALTQATLLAALPELYAESRRLHTTSVPDWLRSVRVAEPEIAELLEAFVATTDMSYLIALVNLIVSPQ